MLLALGGLPVTRNALNNAVSFASSFSADYSMKSSIQEWCSSCRLLSVPAGTLSVHFSSPALHFVNSSHLSVGHVLPAVSGMAFMEFKRKPFTGTLLRRAGCVSGGAAGACSRTRIAEQVPKDGVLDRCVVKCGTRWASRVRQPGADQRNGSRICQGDQLGHITGAGHPFSPKTGVAL